MRGTEIGSATCDAQDTGERDGASGIPGGSGPDGVDALSVGEDGASEGGGSPRRAQLLYIIGASRDGPLKIGISEDPYKRRATLQSGHPERLEVYWVYPCPSSAVIEPVIHALMRPFRMEGEWFRVPMETAMAALWAVAHTEPPHRTEDLHEWCRHIGLCPECLTCSCLHLQICSQEPRG